MITKRNPIFRRYAWVGFAAALLVGAPFASAQEEGRQQHQLNEKVSEGLGKLTPLQNSKNFTGMLELVDGLLKTVSPTSYDAAYLLDIKARILLQLEQLSKAIEPWEQALKLSQQFKYFSQKDDLERMKYIAQLVFSEATTVKDKEQQKQLVQKSASYLKMYLQNAPKPEADVQMLYAQILYFQATEDQNHINQDMLKEARAIVEKGMLGAIRPKEGFYLLLLAILQQQGDHVRSADMMELLLAQYPNKKDVWPMLFGTYVNMAGTAKSESKQQREWFVRAINTIERAQKLGFMNTPRDNYNLFTLYVNAGEINFATDLLHNGMKKGTIESTPANWKILGAYYQQSNKELQAISALQEAAKLFPKDGSIDFVIGQIYQQTDKIKEAHDNFASAIKKGSLEKPHQAYLYLAYTAFEMGNLDEALTAINEAQKSPEGAKDSQVRNLKEGIQNAIQDRDAAKKAREEAVKQQKL